jgi:putative cardiolipin synthase
MHNKTFTVDGQITIIGGRNIGNEYFGFGSDLAFADLDVMAIGPVVKAASRAFDLYWRSPASVPMKSLDDSNPNAKETTAHRAALAAECERLRDSVYLKAEHDNLVMKDLLQGNLVWFWGEARLVYDLPAKVTTDSDEVGEFLMAQLRPIIDATQHEMIIVSPYFVPGKSGVAFFQALRKRGVRVIIITNSLAATDVSAVHAGYRRYRKALLRAGVEIYEFKPTASIKEAGGKRQTSVSHHDGSGSSRASLHAKTFIFDGQKIFVGSLNLDPRSVALNTEIGAVFDIPELAGSAARAIVGSNLQNCYRLELIPPYGATNSACSRIVWLDEEDGKKITYTSEPRATLGRRLLVAIVSLLPIESQL